MAKKYNLGSKSDMRRFQRDLEKTVKEQSKSIIQNQKYDVECPHCGHEINIPTGKSPCPSCRKTIDLNLDIKFN